MKKRAFSCILTLCMLFSLSPLAFASEIPSTLQNQYESFDEFNLNDYIQHTINFNASADTAGIMLATSTDVDRWTQHVNNVEAAKSYVKSLTLPDNGYYDLEKSCLDKLDSFLSEDYRNLDIVLTSYTVLEPKAAPGGMSLFGTVNGREYYQAFVSRETFNIKETHLPKSKLEAWANGGLNLVLCWADRPFTIPFSLLSVVADLGPSYQVLEGDESTAYFNVRLTNREIYTENSLGVWGGNRDPYVKVYQDDKGTAEPFVIYISTKKVNGTYSHETSYDKINVKADNYDNTSTVLYRANNRYLDKHKGSPWVESAVQQVIKINLE